MPRPNSNIGDSRAQDELTNLDGLRSKRSNFDTQWEQAAERLIPAHKTSFTSRSGTANAFSPGQRHQEKMYDATAALALQRFTSVWESISTPQSQQWHRLVPSEPSIRNHRPTRIYLDNLVTQLFQQRYSPSAGFVGQQQKAIMGYGAYGNGFLFVDGQQDGRGLRYKNLHLGETYIIENHQGIVNTMYRSFWLEPGQVVEEYGGSTPASVVKLANDPTQRRTELEILQVVKPRVNFDPRRLDAKGMPFQSLHFLVRESALLRESGYRTFPMPVTRYTQFTNETYGRGPAQTVLPAIKVLNEEKKTIIRQGHKAVDPVILGHNDGVAGEFINRPGAFNSGMVSPDGRPLVHVLPSGNHAIGKDLMDDERQVINDAFLLTLFQILVETPTMTATEVLERAREKGLLIAPTAGRQQAEYLGPMINRELDVLFSQNILPPPPAKLLDSGAGFEIEYDNPMSRMMRSENAAGFMRALDSALQIIQVTQNPAPLDWFDMDAAMPALQDIQGTPTAWTNTLEKVQQIRAQRENERQDQKAIDAAPSIAALAKVQQDKA